MDENAVLTSGSEILGTASAVFKDYLNYRLLDKRIDSEVARPFRINDPTGGAFFIGSDGRLYSPAASAAAATGAARSDGSLVGVGLVILAAVVAYIALRR